MPAESIPGATDEGLQAGAVKPAVAATEEQGDPKAVATDEQGKRMHRAISGDSTDTLYETAEGAAEDDLEDQTPGPKQATLFRKLEHFVAKKWGKKGSPNRPTVTAEQVKEHSSTEDFWVVVDAKVFDVGPFLRGESRHPGGKGILQRQLELTGCDAGERFVRWHNPGGNAIRRAPECFVGDLVGGELPPEMRAKKKGSRLLCCFCRKGDDDD